MATFTRVFGPSVLGLLGAMAFAVPAQAEIKGNCVLDGIVKTVDKDTGRKVPVPIIGGSDKFIFDTLTVSCLMSAKGMVPETVLFEVRPAGWYDNIICGGGGSKAYGNDPGIEILSQTGGSKDYAPAFEDEKYKVIFTTGGHGYFYWHQWDKPEMPADPKDVIGDIGERDFPFGSGSQGDTKEPSDKDWQLAGEIEIGFNTNGEKTFVPPDALTNACVDSFTVAGVIHVDPRP